MSSHPLCFPRVLSYAAFSITAPHHADDVKAALEDLSTVGGVSVTLGHIGLSLGSDGTVFPPGGDDSGNDNVTSLFPVWTVTFDGDCSFENDVWTSCPANIGDLEVCVPLHAALLKRHGNVYPRYEYTNVDLNTVSSKLPPLSRGQVIPPGYSINAGEPNKAFYWDLMMTVDHLAFSLGIAPRPLVKTSNVLKLVKENLLFLTLFFNNIRRFIHDWQRPLAAHLAAHAPLVPGDKQG